MKSVILLLTVLLTALGALFAPLPSANAQSKNIEMLRRTPTLLVGGGSSGGLAVAAEAKILVRGLLRRG